MKGRSSELTQGLALSVCFYKLGNKIGLHEKLSFLKTAGFLKVASFYESSELSLPVILPGNYVFICIVGQDGRKVLEKSITQLDQPCI